MKCVRGLKNKAPQGSYLIKVSLLSQPGGCVLQWWQTAQLRIRTCPVRHDGNFYDVGLYFHKNLYVVSWSFGHVSLFIYFSCSLDLYPCTFRYSTLHKYTSFLSFLLSFSKCPNNHPYVPSAVLWFLHRHPKSSVKQKCHTYIKNIYYGFLVFHLFRICMLRGH